MSKSIFSLYFFFFLTLIACKDDNEPDIIQEDREVVAKGNRLVGLDLLDLTENGTFDENIAIAKDFGIDYLALHLTWNSLEPSPGSYTDPGDALFLLNQVSVANNFKFSLTLRPIDLTGKTVPSDLTNTRFNDTLMVNRFKRLLDFVFSKMPTTTLLNVQIGNEIDGYNISNEPATFWSDYGEFLQEMTDYIHAIDPNVKVGFTGTLYGMSLQANTFRNLQANVDVLGVTYYPIEANFDVKNPTVVPIEINDFLNNVVIKPVFFQEVGYQTSSVNNSNTTQQADFYTEFFTEWDRQANKIQAVNMVRLNDVSLSTAQNLATPFGISDDAFVEYLRTLGLRDHFGTGNNKLAFTTVKELLTERGW